MIKITSNFDSKKFMRGLEQQVHKSAEAQIRRKLGDLAAKGLKIGPASTRSGKFDMQLEGPKELIEEAKRRLS